MAKQRIILGVHMFQMVKTFHVNLILTGFAFTSKMVKGFSVSGETCSWQKFSTLRTLFVGFTPVTSQVMKRGMCRSIHDLKVFYSVVMSDSVNVVNNLRRLEFSVQVLFHKMSVFANLFSININHYITPRVNVFRSVRFFSRNMWATMTLPSQIVFTTVSVSVNRFLATCNYTFRHKFIVTEVRGYYNG